MPSRPPSAARLARLRTAIDGKALSVMPTGARTTRAGPDRPGPARVVRAPVGMTDSAFPSIAILNRASLAALGGRLGMDLAMERFRGNLWVEGLAPWQEFELVGREVRVGGATLRVREIISRCKATTVDPDTGIPDADTLDALSAGWGHQDFGVYAEVVEGGHVAVGDPAEALP